MGTVADGKHLEGAGGRQQGMAEHTAADALVLLPGELGPLDGLEEFLAAAEDAEAGDDVHVRGEHDHLFLHVGVQARDDSHHAHDGGYADDDAQQSQEAAELVGRMAWKAARKSSS